MSTSLMTVEEFLKLQDPPGFTLELHHGIPVQVSRAKLQHWAIQDRLVQILRAQAPACKAGMEFPFRPQPEHELWVADVAWLTSVRYSQIDPDGYLAGAPDLVVEVLSPSNTSMEMLDKEEMCLNSGARQFWIVNPQKQTVKVTSPDGQTRTYASEAAIPLFCAPEVLIQVAAIFADV